MAYLHNKAENIYLAGPGGMDEDGDKQEDDQGGESDDDSSSENA